MKRWMHLTLTLSLLIGTGGVAEAGLLKKLGKLGKKGGCSVDWSGDDRSIAKAGKKCGFFINNQGIGRKEPMPTRVAIGNFQLRFDKTSNEAVTSVRHMADSGYRKDCGDDDRRADGSFPEECWIWEHRWWKETETSQATFTLGNDDIYQFIVDAVYDRYVSMLTERGYEVVPVDTVKNTELYGMLKGDPKANAKKGKIRVSAYGLKNLKVQGAMATNKLPGLNKELGTDAVIDFFATVGLDLDKSGRVSVCLGSSKVGLGNGLDMQFFAGVKETRSPTKAIYLPKASAQVGVKSMGCFPIEGAQSAARYIEGGADLIVNAAALGTVMLEQAAAR
ncbi:hypothetical protein [Moorena bouillonii]|uniref:Uncharacterized protein n=1 Tax=Moorena bouillonii PNG TaxID=568701 RepID=A0A1U7N787_9CYAN|nr:hypothetical protein [Moorena bouillonii]ANM30791.1 hypothetical protein ABI59_16215 [Acidobacteria bacterium Mor1]OLT61806.1 hypothetical protein BJP37_25040 [Moorena bouillonii PNG]